MAMSSIDISNKKEQRFTFVGIQLREFEPFGFENSSMECWYAKKFMIFLRFLKILSLRNVLLSYIKFVHVGFDYVVISSYLQWLITCNFHCKLSTGARTLQTESKRFIHFLIAMVECNHYLGLWSSNYTASR